MHRKESWEKMRSPGQYGALLIGVNSIVLKVLLFFLVPSRAPSNIQLSNLQSAEVKVQWDPLPQQYANGQLLGYRVYFNEYPYYSYLEKAVNTSSASVYMVILRDLKAVQRYGIRVAAFTSKGVGPRSYYLYITTGNLVTWLLLLKKK